MEQQSQCGMERHDRILHELLDIGETLLASGAEINRVEDTITRLSSAYGAEEINIFVITSDIVLTVLFRDGVELTQTRRIHRAASSDFAKLEQLNALSRACCAEPLPLDELHERVQKITAEQPNALEVYVGSAVGGGCFAMFFGGNIYDGLTAALLGTIICLLQRKVMPVFRNAAVFQFLTSLLIGSIGCFAVRLLPVLNIQFMMSGDIMLLIQGLALTNSVRDMLVGHTISGLLRLSESLLLAGALALGFGGAMFLFGV